MFAYIRLIYFCCFYLISSSTYYETSTLFLIYIKGRIAFIVCVFLEYLSNRNIPRCQNEIMAFTADQLSLCFQTYWYVW